MRTIIIYRNAMNQKTNQKCGIKTTRQPRVILMMKISNKKNNKMNAKDYVNLNTLSDFPLGMCISFVYGVFVGGLSFLHTLIIGLIVYQLFLIVVLRKRYSAWYHITASLYYILGWFFGRLLFHQHGNFLFHYPVTPWAWTDDFETFMNAH
eukprot:Lithocolla_globosa_v1_NODE_3_length_14236_cov_22.745998.p12 type:complete len:151 gc:universal NODE_3_length_14236_cov_22.745998:10332-9880(-)